MPISPPATSFPTLPPPLVPQTLSFFDDFIYTSQGAATNFPLEFGSDAGFDLVNSAGVDFNHPGVIEADLTGVVALAYMTDSATQGVVLNEWETFDIEWQWFFTGFGAATNFSIGMGINKTANACTSWPNQIGIGFTNGNALCTNFPSNNNLFAMTGSGGVNTYTVMRAITPLFGTWITSRILWTKALAQVDFFTNSTKDATITTNIPTGFGGGGVKGFFGCGSFNSVAPGAGNFLRFDYLSFNGTLSR